MRLNPCFSGSWVLRVANQRVVEEMLSLNPCFSGSWVLSAKFENESFDKKKVLILVLVEVGF